VKFNFIPNKFYYLFIYKNIFYYFVQSIEIK